MIRSLVGGRKGKKKKSYNERQARSNIPVLGNAVLADVGVSLGDSGVGNIGHFTKQRVLQTVGKDKRTGKNMRLASIE